MTKHKLKLTFLQDDGNDVGLYLIITPANVTDLEIQKEIEKAHTYLCEEDTEELYGNNGRNQIILLTYINEKKGWIFESLEPDINVELF